MSKEDMLCCDVKEKKIEYRFKKTGIYVKIKSLGSGSFGKVILVEKKNDTNQSNSNRFSIKISRRPEPFREDELNFIEIRELFIMKRIRHKNVINLIDFQLCHKEKEIWILMEYLSTDLFKFHRDNKNNPKVMNERFWKNIFHQILEGVNYLHENMIMHRDLKLENILYDEEKNIVKICDFGLSRQYDYEIEHRYTDVGTYPFKPPEVLLGLTHYSTAFDIWSMGCIFAKICTDEYFFEGENSIQVIRSIYKILGSFNDDVLPGYQNFPGSHLLKSLPEEKGSGLINEIKTKQLFEFENDDFYDLIEKMLCIDPTRRISAKKCLEHRWFSSLKTDDSFEKSL